jgi:shikimate kinase
MILTQNVFLIGPVGSGKSTIGRQLAAQLKLDFFDSDREIERRCGVDIDWIFDIEGEEGFFNRERNLLKELVKMQGIVLATGGTSILSSENRTLLSSRGKVVYLKASIEQQLQRTSRDKKRPILQVKDKRSKLVEVMSKCEPLYNEIADITLETSNATVINVVQRIKKLLIDDVCC